MTSTSVSKFILEAKQEILDTGTYNPIFSTKIM
jgi:hypothetical protein